MPPPQTALSKKGGVAKAPGKKAESSDSSDSSSDSSDEADKTPKKGAAGVWWGDSWP